MALRIGIAGLSHETNVYATSRIGPTELDRFKVTVGTDILDRYADTRPTVGGAIADAREGHAELVPLIHAEASPSETISIP